MNPGGHPTASPTHTIANRILVFFLLAIAGFVVALTYSVFALRLAARDTERLAQGFLPGSHALAQLRASHGTIATLTDGIPDERNPIATRYLLERLLTARKLRFSDTRVAIEQGARLFDDDAAVRTLERYLVDLATIETTLREDAELFERLFTSLERGERDSINRTLVELGKIEHDSDRSLQALADRLQGSMDALTQSTRQREMRTRVALIALAIGAFAVAALATLFSRRLLKPLAAITERARSVAAGDLSPRDTLLTGDELGELSSAFEKMVTALSAEQAKSLSNERLAAIGKMAAHVTHEVRNPLSSIGLNLEMLEEELATAARVGVVAPVGPDAAPASSSSGSQESMSLVRSIRREVERLEKLSEEYLRVAKLPSPRMEAENFLDVVRAAVDFVRSDLEKQNVSIVTDIATTLPSVVFDEAQIRQALLNLLRNAKDAMKTGGEVTLTVTTEGMSVVVSIRDEGEGVPPELAETIFEPFFSTKGEGGTGLGLAITKHIVVSHGGKIWCNTAGPGAEFCFSLPIAPARSADAKWLE